MSMQNGYTSTLISKHRNQLPSLLPRRKTWQMRPPIYHPVQRRGEVVHKSSMVDIQLPSISLNNKLIHASGSIVDGSLHKCDDCIEVASPLPTGQPKSSAKTEKMQPHFLKNRQKKAKKKCELCDSVLRDVKGKRVCEQCTVELIMGQDRMWSRNMLLNISNCLDDLLGRKKASESYMKVMKKNKESLIHSLLTLTASQIPTSRRRRPKLFTNTSVPATPQNSPRPSMDYLWRKVRQVANTKETAESRNRRELIKVKLWEVVLAIASSSKTFNKAGQGNNSAMTKLLKEKQHVVDSFWAETVDQKSDAKVDLDFKAYNQPKKYYQTLREAKRNILDTRRVFTSVANPAVKFRPSWFWTALERQNIAGNMKPLLTALQANRLDSPFDCFLGEKWITEFKKHSMLEKERVKVTLAKQRRQDFNLEVVGAGQRKKKSSKAAAETDINLTVKELWNKHGIKSQLAMKSRKTRLERDGAVKTGSTTLSKMHKERTILERVQKQGRRRAITEHDIDAVLQVRLSKSSLRQRTGQNAGGKDIKRVTASASTISQQSLAPSSSKSTMETEVKVVDEVESATSSSANKTIKKPSSDLIRKKKWSMKKKDSR